ncbi:MAG: hypothetical protein Q9180_005314, partial [Flavoplaca navasiana]
MYPDVWRPLNHDHRAIQPYRPVNKSPSSEYERLRERKKRYFRDVDNQVEQGYGLMGINATQRYYARSAYPDLYYGQSENNRHTGGHSSLRYETLPAMARTKSVSTTVTREPFAAITDGPPQQPYTESTPPMPNGLAKGGYAEDQPVITRQPYLSADVAVLLELLKSPSRPLQRSMVPSFTANLAEKRQDGERKNLTENGPNENLTAGGLAPKPPRLFTGKTSFRHPSVKPAAERRPSHRPIVIEISDGEEDNIDHRQMTTVGTKEAATTGVRENDHSTDAKSEIP